MGAHEPTLVDIAAGWAAMGIEAAGVIAIVLGVVVTSAAFLRDMAAGRAGEGYDHYRRRLGRAILIGLELLVAADIIRTVAAPLELRNVAALGLVVLIRTVLSLSIEVEITGRWPWRAAQAPPDHPKDQGIG